tara:strand:- start:1637 stop:1888 length:252 start_codon:yes stop_codon:yes gene_type:complete
MRAHFSLKFHLSGTEKWGPTRKSTLFPGFDLEGFRRLPRDNQPDYQVVIFRRKQFSARCKWLSVMMIVSSEITLDGSVNLTGN